MDKPPKNKFDPIEDKKELYKIGSILSENRDLYPFEHPYVKHWVNEYYRLNYGIEDYNF